VRAWHTARADKDREVDALFFQQVQKELDGLGNQPSGECADDGGIGKNGICGGIHAI